MQPTRAERRGSRLVMWTIVLLALALLLTLNCSGLLFPVWNPPGTLNEYLARDFKLSLPPGATVTNGTRIATRDPAAYFRVELPTPGDAIALVARVRGSAASPEDEDPSQPWMMGPTPDWWRPRELPSVKRLDVGAADAQGGYTWYYSDSSTVVYVFWFRT